MGDRLAPDERFGLSECVEDLENVGEPEALPEHADSCSGFDEGNQAAGLVDGSVGADQLSTSGGIAIWNIREIEDESFHAGMKQFPDVLAQRQQRFIEHKFPGDVKEGNTVSCF